MSAQSVLEAARAVVARWRVLLGGVYLDSATREELEDLIRAVDDHPEPAIDPARLPQPSGDLPWRVGRRIPIHLYDGKGHPLGTMLTVKDAARVVESVNELEAAQGVFQRLVTVADEAFGLAQVETAHETLTRLEEGLFKLRQERSELIEQRNALENGGRAQQSEVEAGLAEKARAALARVTELERQVSDLVGKLAAERSGGPAVRLLECLKVLQESVLADGWLCPKESDPQPRQVRCCPEAFLLSDARKLLTRAGWYVVAVGTAVRKLEKLGELEERIALAKSIADNCSGDYLRAVLDGEIDAAEHERRKL